MAAQSAKKRWKLDSITIRNFRGVLKEHTFQFTGKPALLRGKNGTGKSTVTQGLQWALYGKFPPNVLWNKSFDRFLPPIRGKKKACFCNVKFVRGRDQLSICRDQSTGGFTVTHNTVEYSGEEAEQKRDELLGLDMDTFTRAVVLHQSRIRGLLVDEPRERNKALDRLLGMDTIEQLQSLVDSKKFSEAAEQWRLTIQREDEKFETREELLKDQLDRAQRSAREFTFTSKDFNKAGLKKAYATIGIDISELGSKYKVDLDELPTCNSIDDVKGISKSFKEAIKNVRVNSDLRNRLNPIEKQLSQVSSLSETWEETRKEIKEVKANLKELVKEHGEKAEIKNQKNSLENNIKKLEDDLRIANELRQLLVDAHEYIVKKKPTKCPVCEKDIAKSRKLDKDLEGRIETFRSNNIVKIGNKLDALKTQLSDIKALLESYEESEELSNKIQEKLAKQRASIVDALGGSGIAENKVSLRLKESIAKLEADQKKLTKGIEAMEEDLRSIEIKEGAIREGLVEVIQKKEEIKEHEDERNKAKERHKEEQARADKLDELSQNFGVLRQAMLDAKDKLATKNLSKARPRAQALYKTLVNHPLFNTLSIETKQSAKKMDYTFMVSVGDDSKTARDAWLVLSDGQLTATALGLFYALAESTIHGLDLLYIDDPTQNLDLPSKEQMAKVVSDMATRKQVIVSTQDEDFENFLESEGFLESAISHHFKKWDSNPTIEMSLPAGESS